MGIELSGETATGGLPKVIRNLVRNVHGTNSGGNTGESVGISITDLGIGAVVSGNVIQNDTKAGLAFAHGASMAVWCGGASDVLVADNILRTWDYGVVSSSPPSVGHGQNMFVNCTTDSQIGGLLDTSTED